MPLAATTPVAGSAPQWWRCLRPQSRLEPLPSLAYGRRWLRRPIWRCTGRHRRIALRRASLSREAAEPAITDPSDIEQLLAANRAPLSRTPGEHRSGRRDQLLPCIRLIRFRNFCAVRQPPQINALSPGSRGATSARSGRSRVTRLLLRLCQRPSGGHGLGPLCLAHLEERFPFCLDPAQLGGDLLVLGR